MAVPTKGDKMANAQMFEIGTGKGYPISLYQFKGAGRRLCSFCMFDTVDANRETMKVTDWTIATDDAPFSDSCDSCDATIAKVVR